MRLGALLAWVPILVIGLPGATWAQVCVPYFVPAPPMTCTVSPGGPSCTMHIWSAHGILGAVVTPPPGAPDLTFDPPTFTLNDLYVTVTAGPCATVGNHSGTVTLSLVCTATTPWT